MTVICDNTQDAVDAIKATETLDAIAKVNGELVLTTPKDLFIPPDALSIFLEAFEGPLDLLLYLIRKQKLDILQLPMQQITAQYMEYVELMTTLKIELAGEYLVMAALLSEIKSRLLLPKPEVVDETEEDPRAVLIRQLQEYEIFKSAAEKLAEHPKTGTDIFIAGAVVADNMDNRPCLPEVTLKDLAFSLQKMLQKAAHYEHHQIQREVLTTREKMTQILSLLGDGKVHTFQSVINPEEGKGGVVASFLAILELVKESLITLIQNSLLGDIYLSLAE